MPTPHSWRGSRRNALGEPRRGALYLHLYFACVNENYPQAEVLKDNKVKERARALRFLKANRIKV